MSLTARASAFSIAFGGDVAGVGDTAQSIDRARARDLAADVPAHAVGDDEERDTPANIASWLTSRRRPVWVTAAQ